MYLFPLLLACTVDPLPVDSTSTPGESDTDTDTDADTDTDTDTDTDADTDSIYDHVLLDLTVAGRTEGFDLDGDGEGDNAIWVLGGVLDPVLAGLLDSATRVVVMQVADVGELAADPSAQLALVSAEDTDGDPSDNGAGETFAAGASVDAAGRALVGVEISLTDGAYATTLLDGSFAVGTWEMEASTPLQISGAVTAGSHVGFLGLGMPVDALTAALEAAGQPEAAGGVAALADLDTDGDGEEDAVSMAFAFAASPCSLSN